MDNKIYNAINKLLRINRGHKHLLDSKVAEIGVHRTGHRILMYLARKGNLPSQKELAEYLEITPAAVTGSLQRLESDGFIERSMGSDNRYNEIMITDKGRAIVDKTRMMFASVDNSLFSGFTDEEIAEFTGYLERIIDNLKGEEK